MPEITPAKPRVLILGGTRDAATLAYAAVAEFNDDVEIISSLAGRTATPDLPGTVRSGGFGGADGLQTYLEQEKIDAIIDATHPFAAQISESAAAACIAANVARLSLIRPPWPLKTDGPWIDVASMTEAVDTLNELNAKRVFVSTGVTDLQAFTRLSNVFFLVRLISEPSDFPLANSTIVTGKPPFSADEEITLMQSHDIDTMVTKNSGGDLNQGKIEAVTALNLRTIVIRRPDHPSGEKVETVEQSISWLKRQLSSVLA